MRKLTFEEKLKIKKNRVYQNKLKSYEKHKLKQTNKPDYVINQNMQKLRVSNRKFLKGFSANNTDMHERLKFEAAWYCIKKGWDVCLEAIFTNGRRADIYIPFLDTVIEILKSETPAECIKKLENYPNVSMNILLESKKGIKANIEYLEKTL